MVTHDRIRLTACYGEAPRSSWTRGLFSAAPLGYAQGMPPTAEQLAASLRLAPHPEGGFYRETYRSALTLRTPRGERSASTSILFLVTAGSISRMHRLACDELWLHQGGLPLELVTIAPEGELQRRVLGLLGAPRPAAGGVPAPEELPQAPAPAGSWLAARLAGGPHLPAELAWALVACVCTPGFDFGDFELGERERLLAAYPQHRDVVEAFT